MTKTTTKRSAKPVSRKPATGPAAMAAATKAAIKAAATKAATKAAATKAATKAAATKAATKAAATKATIKAAATKAAATKAATKAAIKAAATKAATKAAATKAAATKAAATKAATKAAATKAAIKAAATKPATKAAATKAATKAAATKPATKAAATKPAATKAAATKATKAAAESSARPSEASAGAGSDWRADLRRAVEEAGPDFAVYLAELGLSGEAWEHADTAELAGLERWGTELAKRDRRAGIGALVLAAQHGMPIVLERGGIGLDGMNFKADEPSMDGAPVEKQIQLAAAWLDAPDAKRLAAVTAGCDPSRQLQIWDDDLRPSDDSAYWWYSDVGQCCGYAITRTGGNAAKDSYYEWPPETCVGRGLVLAVRGLRSKGESLHGILADLRAALVAGPI